MDVFTKLIVARRETARRRARLAALPDHLRRDIGLPERDATMRAISRRIHNPYAW